MPSYRILRSRSSLNPRAGMRRRATERALARLVGRVRLPDPDDGTCLPPKGEGCLGVRSLGRLGALVAAAVLASACSGQASKSETSNASGAGSDAAGRGGSGYAGNDASGGGGHAGSGGESGAAARGGTDGGGAAGTGGGAGTGGSAMTDSCLTFCAASRDQGCSTATLADCQNYCRQSFGPACPEAKEIWFRCVLDNDMVCVDRHACDDEHDNFVALGCQGMPQ